MSAYPVDSDLALRKDSRWRSNAGAVLGTLWVAAVSIFGIWIIGTRGMDIGSDTDAYAWFLLAMDRGVPETRLEPGFVYLTYMLRQAGLDVIGYQAVLFALLLLTVIVSTRQYYRYLDAQRGYLTLLCASLLLLYVSPMFVNASVNAIRQGLAALLVFASLLCFHQKKWRGFLVLGALATSMHYSSLLYLACAPALLLPRNMLRLLAAVAFIAYVSGVSMIAVRVASPALYSTVMEYTEHPFHRAGVRVDFAVFTIFWYVLANLLTGLVKEPFRDRIADSTAVYLIMVLPFFLIGWGFFSNRYLLPGWLAASLIFAALVWHSRVPLVRNPLLIRIALLASCPVFYFLVTRNVVI